MFVGKKIEVQLFGGTIFPHRVPFKTPSVTPSGRPLSGIRSLPIGKLVDIAEPLFEDNIIQTF